MGVKAKIFELYSPNFQGWHTLTTGDKDYLRISSENSNYCYNCDYVIGLFAMEDTTVTITVKVDGTSTALINDIP